MIVHLELPKDMEAERFPTIRWGRRLKVAQVLVGPGLLRHSRTGATKPGVERRDRKAERRRFGARKGSQKFAGIIVFSLYIRRK